MNIQSSVGLLVASLGLQEVQDVIGAMRAADAQVARGRLAAEAPIAQTSPVSHAPRSEDRRPGHQPAPLRLPPVIYYRPQIERGEHCRRPERECRLPIEVVVFKTPNESPIQPPWKTVPWENPPQIISTVKLAPSHPDICDKGRLLDYFI